MNEDEIEAELEGAVMEGELLQVSNRIPVSPVPAAVVTARTATRLSSDADALAAPHPEMALLLVILSHNFVFFWDAANAKCIVVVCSRRGNMRYCSERLP
ncbi:hypothetical protein EJ110_NYTH10719 [Nymphaea thermarum]|nr:hypothetical protein EJ110_NYTH10719 [Nymphaea thermarum]